MHNEKRRLKMMNYAKILLVISITLLIYGVVLDINSDRHLLDPGKDVETVPDNGKDVTISTIDDITVKPETENPSVPQEVTPSPEVPSTPEVTPSVQPEGVQPSNPVPYVPTIDDINNQIRNQILEQYGVAVRYGSETVGYTIMSGNTKITTEPITDSTAINSQLNRLKTALALYPAGLFTEIKNGGIPLTVYLIDHYSNSTITGITDSSYSFANISIAAMYPFEESFYHESYHYIERYMFKKGANFNSWDLLNPEGFTYGTVYNDLSYNITFSQDAYFVNNYAQSLDTEDRACTFEYMMAPNKASCLNQNMKVWAKAKYMALTMEATLRSVKLETVEYWERFL